MDFRYHADPEKLSQRVRVDLVGLDLRVTNGLYKLGVGQAQIVPFGFEQIIHPVPAGCRLDGGMVFSGKGPEICPNRLGIVFELRGAYDISVLIECCQKACSLMLIDTREIDCFHEVPLFLS